MPSTLAYAVLGNTRSVNRAATQLALILGGSLLIAALAQIRIPLPFTPVPITGQTLAVLLIGTVLGARRGAAATVLYLLEGSAGLPFFSGGAAGFAHLMGPTGGYLVSFPVAAFLVGWMAERRMDRKFITSLPAFIAGHALIFAAGVTWLSFYVGRDQALVAGLLPFIPGAVVKTALLAVLLPGAWKYVDRLDR